MQTPLLQQRLQYQVLTHKGFKLDKAGEAAQCAQPVLCNGISQRGAWDGDSLTEELNIDHIIEGLHCAFADGDYLHV